MMQHAGAQRLRPGRWRPRQWVEDQQLIWYGDKSTEIKLNHYKDNNADILTRPWFLRCNGTPETLVLRVLCRVVSLLTHRGRALDPRRTSSARFSALRVAGIMSHDPVHAVRCLKIPEGISPWMDLVSLIVQATCYFGRRTHPALVCYLVATNPPCPPLSEHWFLPLLHTQMQDRTSNE